MTDNSINPNLLNSLYQTQTIPSLKLTQIDGFLTMPCDKHYYKYNGHIFLSKSGLLAYAGLNEGEFYKIADKVKKI